MQKVVKFGGSSLADANQFQKVKNIIQADSSRRIVVVSALGKRNKSDHKITDLLFLTGAHLKYGVDAKSVFNIVKERYFEVKKDLNLSIDLEKEFEIKTDHTLGEELNDMCNLGEGIWERGIETGISQGLQTGITEKTKIIIKNMLSRGMSDDDIRALAECEQELIDAVRNRLSQ